MWIEEITQPADRLSAFYGHLSIVQQTGLSFLFTLRPQKKIQYGWVRFQSQELKHIWINPRAKLQSQPYAPMVAHAKSENKYYLQRKLSVFISRCMLA